LDRGQLGQVIKNALLDALCALNPPPGGLGGVLAQMYEDPQQDEVVRDYAVQHLAAYYEQMSRQDDSATTEQAVQNVLWAAVNETSDSIAGTALLALKRLSQEYAGFDQEKIATTALQLAGDNDAGELTRISAYEVCAQLKTMEALPVVLQAAQDGETLSVKLSAIGALGSLGGPEEVSFLNSVLAGTEDRLKPAARHALEQINARQNQLPGQK
jgi:HEAT repeat protein